MAAMLLAGLTNLREVVAVAAGHRVHGVPHLSFPGVEATVAIPLVALAVAAVWPRRSTGPRYFTRALPPLVVLAAVVLLLDLLFGLYANIAAERPLTAAEVAFLLAALLWDVAFSGELVNRDGRLVRRPARVLLYMGYMLAAGATVLYFASGHSLGTLKIQGTFSLEAETALSLAFVGVAYAIVTTAGRLTHRAGAAATADD